MTASSHGWVIRRTAIVAILACLFFAETFAQAQPPHQVRFGYVVPNVRTPQANAVSILREYLPTMQQWYGEQMDRYGFGFKTFRFETEPDGVMPRIRTVRTATTDATIRGDIWGQTISAASGAGLPIWSTGQVWMLMSEAHLQQANGSVIGGTALGASFGSGSDAGVAMLGSDALFRLDPDMLTNNQTYAGRVVPEIGPRPLVQGVSFPGFEGSTFSSIASSVQGAFGHELGHAFGLAHDFRNDANFHGNLMGNGLRGFRAAEHPQQYPSDDIQLSYAAALALNTSRYFNPNRTYTDNTRPALSIRTSGNVTPTNGHLPIQFTASDSSGLSAALLKRNGDTIGELVLSGTTANLAFLTPYYMPGTNDEFTIAVYDTQGNMRSSSVQITPAGGFNRAPQPSIALFPSTIDLGGVVRFDASRSSDPDHSLASLRVEWDLNGDGVFDTAPSTSKTLQRTFPEPGAHLIFARLTDPAGAISISTPLALRVIPEPSALVLAAIAILALLTVALRRHERGLMTTRACRDRCGVSPR